MSRRQHSSFGPALLGVLAVVGVAAGACDRDDGEEPVASGCAVTVEQASMAVEPSEQLRLLDQAFIRCRSYAALTTEMARYPGITGYDLETFVTLRCSRVEDEAIANSPACAAVVQTTTTPPPTTVPQLVYVGETLDGRVVELRPDANIPFDGDRPAAIQQTVDIAVESGCEGVYAQRDVWAAQVGDPDIGTAASVFAKHAENVAAFIGCPPG